MSDDRFTSIDTITIAAVMRALQTVLDAYQTEQPDPRAFRDLETRVMAEIKALDTGDFEYEEQAEGLAEGLLLTRSVFRYAQQARLLQPTPKPDAVPAPASEKSLLQGTRS
ncbi:hypothetical protein [Alsobacter sp. SYSU BS001988]|jgi:hypothetical protein